MGNPDPSLGGSSSAGVLGSSGSSGGGFSGASGGAASDPKYECSPSVNIDSEQTATCIKKVCSNLGYQCGPMGNGCVGATTPCGVPASMFSCSDFVNSCPAYSGCENHVCTN